MSVTAEQLVPPAPGDVAFSAGLIADRVDELARQISGDYRGRGPGPAVRRRRDGLPQRIDGR